MMRSRRKRLLFAIAPILALSACGGKGTAAEITVEQCWLIQAALRNATETVALWRDGDRNMLKMSIGDSIDAALGHPADEAGVFDRWLAEFAPARKHYDEELSGQAAEVLNSVCVE